MTTLFAVLFLMVVGVRAQLTFSFNGDLAVTPSETTLFSGSVAQISAIDSALIGGLWIGSNPISMNSFQFTPAAGEASVAFAQFDGTQTKGVQVRLMDRNGVVVGQISAAAYLLNRDIITTGGFSFATLDTPAPMGEPGYAVKAFRVVYSAPAPATPSPTPQPSPQPTPQPSPQPTPRPTPVPTPSPTPIPTQPPQVLTLPSLSPFSLFTTSASSSEASTALSLSSSPPADDSVMQGARRDPPDALVIGGAAGGGALLLLLIVIALVCLKRRRRSVGTVPPARPSIVQPYSAPRSGTYEPLSLMNDYSQVPADPTYAIGSIDVEDKNARVQAITVLHRD
jgi:hypothetical protein